MLTGAALVGGASSAQHVTTYEYDSLGRLTKVDYQSGHERSFTFDDAGNITEVSCENPSNSAPSGGPDTIFLSGIGDIKFVNLTGNDTDANPDIIKILSIVPPSNATVTLNGARTGATFVATAEGEIGFSYTIIDGKCGQDSVVGTVNVNEAGGGCGPFGCGGGPGDP